MSKCQYTLKVAVPLSQLPCQTYIFKNHFIGKPGRQKEH